jgi:hypothetical protein
MLNTWFTEAWFIYNTTVEVEDLSDQLTIRDGEVEAEAPPEEAPPMHPPAEAAPLHHHAEASPPPEEAPLIDSGVPPVGEIPAQEVIAHHVHHFEHPELDSLIGGLSDFNVSVDPPIAQDDQEEEPEASPEGPVQTPSLPANWKDSPTAYSMKSSASWYDRAVMKGIVKGYIIAKAKYSGPPPKKQ